MEITILNEEKNTLEISIDGQGHTICNALRSELAKSEDVVSAGYHLKHPQTSKVSMMVTVSKGKPKKAIEDAGSTLRAKIKDLKGLVKKL